MDRARNTAKMAPAADPTARFHNPNASPSASFLASSSSAATTPLSSSIDSALRTCLLLSCLGGRKADLAEKDASAAGWWRRAVSPQEVELAAPAAPGWGGSSLGQSEASCAGRGDGADEDGMRTESNSQIEETAVEDTGGGKSSRHEEEEEGGEEEGGDGDEGDEAGDNPPAGKGGKAGRGTGDTECRDISDPGGRTESNVKVKFMKSEVGPSDFESPTCFFENLLFVVIVDVALVAAVSEASNLG